MKVRELIHLLMEMPQEAEVFANHTEVQDAFVIQARVEQISWTKLCWLRRTKGEPAEIVRLSGRKGNPDWDFGLISEGWD